MGFCLCCSAAFQLSFGSPEGCIVGGGCACFLVTRVSRALNSPIDIQSPSAFDNVTMARGFENQRSRTTTKPLNFQWFWDAAAISNDRTAPGLLVVQFSVLLVGSQPRRACTFLQRIGFGARALCSSGTWSVAQSC